MNKVAILFSGQGSQYIGMGQALYNQDSNTQALFDKASKVVGVDMAKLCFEGPAEELNKTENAQPALLLCATAAYQALKAETELEAELLAGHSLGELSALVASNALSFEDGIALARARGLAMKKCGNDGVTGMVAITKLAPQELLEICNEHPKFKETFVVANFNSPKQQVLSGNLSDMEEISDKVKAKGGAFIKLRVSGAFHSPYMEQAAVEFEEYLAGIKIAEPETPVVSNVTGQVYQSAEEIRVLLVKQITSPVMWQSSITENMQEIDVFIETGPGEVLQKITLAIDEENQAFSFDNEEQKAQLLKVLEQDIIRWKNKPNILGKCLAVAVATRNKNWDDNEYKVGVVEQYNKMKSLYEETVEQGSEPSDEQVNFAMSSLIKILQTKQLANAEIDQRLHNVIKTTAYPRSLNDIVPEWQNA